ncbi:LacI family DNA-binding transcriptional regulator [Amaricoccus tamworthensis]|uniref:LacI family DNA-binding transcriptional regulator n=1 Tax=Amaricoccus tamworthensis TaxID=57002 RepID=UPI003C7C4265
MARPGPGGDTVTMKTIATELGVSVTTVARALKDGHKVGPELVARVRDTADRLGYVRNLEGAKLRTGRTLVAMAFLSFTEQEEIGDSGSIGLLQGIHKWFAGTDYSVRAVPVAMGDLALEQVREVVRGRNADGLILDHTQLLDDRVKYLLEADFPFITFGRTELLSPHAFFDVDNEYAAWQSTDALLRDGYRRVALVDGDLRYSFVRQRLRGYETALREHGIDPDPALYHHDELRADRTRQAAAGLINAGADAFVCVNELSFLGVRAGVRDRMGPDVERYGFALRSGTNLADYVATRVYTSHFSNQQAGRRLAELLLKRIEGAPPGDCQELVKTTLRINGTPQDGV